jgi:ectoine hydroxylase-related dioxygenase (phytanoyl-CoA dioxygenase family)
MPQSESPTEDMLAAFARDGVMKLPGLLPAEAVEAARDAVRRALAKLDLWNAGGWQLAGKPRPAVALKPARDIGHNHAEVNRLMANPALMAIIARLLGNRPLDRTIHAKSQVLCSLPNAETWRMPASLHTDLPRLPGGQSPGVQAFAFLEPVAPRGGGTVVVAGSHRLLDDRGALRPREAWRALRDEPFFRRLAREPQFAAGEPLPDGWCGGVPLKVLELTGEPGDVWITDLRVLHAAAPNASDRPRVMVTDRFVPAELVPAISAAYGWT